MTTAAELIRAFRMATPAEQKQLREAIGMAGGGGQTAATIAANVESLRQGLEVLTEGEATALLSDSSYQVWGVDRGDLIARLVPFLDAHWEALESELGRLCLLCGEYGKSLLMAVERRVRESRRKRGGAEIGALLTLMQMAEQQEKGDEDVLADYQRMVGEYAGAMGKEPGSLVFRGWTMGDLMLLRRCKEWLRAEEPGVFWGDWRELNVRLAVVFSDARRSGMDPQTRAAEGQIRSERSQNLNVLYEGLRKGEERKWGGIVRDVNGRPDDGSGIWGGAVDAMEMAGAIAKWMEGRAKEQGVEGAERGGYRLMP